MAVIEVVRGDITREQTDAIVTAANESLMGGGGVDRAIHRAAGPRLAEAGAVIAPCAPGDAKATPAFDLDPPVRHVIHTVGPVWEGGGHGEADLLASCYRRCLEVADGLGARSIAFPAIATGVYGFPAGEAARIAVSTLLAAATDVLRVRLIAFDETTHGLLEAELARQTDDLLLSQLDPTSAAWDDLLAVATDFTDLPHAESDFRWVAPKKQPNGVIHVGYPVYGERVAKARQALSAVGAVTPKYPWTEHRPPSLPADGTQLAPADAVRLATTIVRGERFSDGTIGKALEDGVLQAIVASLATWYRTRR